MKKTLKSIISTVLAMAILLTGVSFSGTMTASAAMATYEMDGYTVEQLTTKVSMLPGDVRRFTLISTSGLNCAGNFDWKSSDESVVSIKNMCKGAVKDHYVILTAQNEGTATVTLTAKYGTGGFTMNVTVGHKEATAKQKSCKHKWKVTKKATCQRYGTKTCTKCKLTKSVKKKDHKWVKTLMVELADEGHYMQLVCNVTVGCNPECQLEATKKGVICEHSCEFCIDSDDYEGPNRLKQMVEDMKYHQLTEHGGGFYSIIEGWETDKQVEVWCMTCDYCGKMKD